MPDTTPRRPPRPLPERIAALPLCRTVYNPQNDASDA